MALRDLLRERASLATIRDHLDGLAPEVRTFEANSLSRKEQSQLFELAGEGPPIRLSHFVPDELGARRAVHHPGLNTVPTFNYFKHFQKRFMKPEEPSNSGKLGGYNASNAWFIRPGYFVAYETDGVHTPADRRAEWSRRGGVVIDYFMVPEGWSTPEGWPKVVPNSSGLQRFVYHQTRDFMRGVSKHVSIGKAATEDKKGDRELDYWFTLVREEPRPAALLR